MAWSYEGMSLAEAWRSADDVAEDDDDILIIPSDAYLSDEDDGLDTSIDDEMFDDDGFDE